VRDFIYEGADFESELIKLFPTAIITNTSNGVYKGRLLIEIPEIPQEEYFKKMYMNGFFNMSLAINMSMMENPFEFKRQYKKWEEEVKEEPKDKNNSFLEMLTSAEDIETLKLLNESENITIFNGQTNNHFLFILGKIAELNNKVKLMEKSIQDLWER